ncbi:zinc finger/helix-turn-helix protein, YgiT family [Bacteriovorax sp. BAL6_X]|uniref:hypothetical protein n=1 Tax=Bacteriovorax sp. BAL6_X TaxID=1201290 RepID=UPI000386D2A4|nr:hypothetical protein [Bacteriovorax sp. BAL6_X]EPZ49851.1 zinc finger/helix-turn-helix protein, YgiT family [Bacteriovorax sp. BAL6_X]
MKSKCLECLSIDYDVINFEFVSDKKKPNGEAIIIKDAEMCRCQKCGSEWMSGAQIKALNEKIEELSYESLTPARIAEIRESMPFKTKADAAKFFCFNHKAFIKWEKGYSSPNKSADLLMRLVARSEENFNFVKELHDKAFRFDLADYHFLVKAEAVQVDEMNEHTYENNNATRSKEDKSYLWMINPTDNTADDYAMPMAA